MRRKRPYSIPPGFLITLLFLVASCSGRGDRTQTEEEGVPMSIQLTSSAFAEGKPIPAKYTCDGADVSPPLAWSNVPEGTKSLVLISDDPDAPVGTWVHWVIYNIPPDATDLAEGVPKSEVLTNGATQGMTDFKRIGYGGPCPPRGGPHRYFFKLYALDTGLELKPGATKQELLRAMEGHILAEGQLMGTYQRR
jgi:Raf kinase inhibitor-like YbhB/YbcL family protein